MMDFIGIQSCATWDLYINDNIDENMMIKQWMEWMRYFQRKTKTFKNQADTN